jgi:protein-disulfide isomerase
MNRILSPTLLGLLCVLALAGTPACAQDTPGTPAARRAAAEAGMPRDSVIQRAQRSRIRGSEDAPVMIFEISDFQCPFCRRFVEETYPALDSAYIQQGHVRLMFINLPLPHHLDSWSASEAALCAGAQDAFWQMRDVLFRNQREWSQQGLNVDRVSGYAAELGLDVPAFRYCVENNQVASIIVGDLTQAAGAGIGGTPTFIINGNEVISGAVPFEEFRQRIDPLLAGAPAPRQ